jgi:hypothetical protein
MVEYGTLALVLTGLGLTASILYYTMALRNANKTQQLAMETRQAQLFMQMYNRWRDSIANDDFGSVISRKISNWEELKSIFNSDENYQRIFNELAGFYEGLGVLVKAGYLSIHPIALMWTGVSTLFWTNVLEPTIDEWRTELNLRRLWSEAEYLCRELMQYIEEHPELKA